MAARVSDMAPASGSAHLVGIAKAVRFDPQRRAASDDLKEAIRRIVTSVEAHEVRHCPRTRDRGEDKRTAFHTAIEAIICNLAALRLDPFKRALAVPRSSGVMWSGTRYAEPIYGQHFLVALEYLSHPDIGIVQDRGRGYCVRGVASEPSVIQCGPTFEVHLPPGSVSWEAFRRVPAAEVIVLKTAKDEGDVERAKPQDYPPGEKWPDRWREEVQTINAWLADAPFWLLHDVECTGGRLAEPIDPTRRPLRRVFTGGSWGVGGGRLYDGFWIDMPKAERFRRLRIASAAHPEGEGIAVVDLRQFNPRAAYAHANKQPPDGDLYDIGGDGLFREGFKRMVNAMLSANKRMKQFPDKAQSLFPPGTKVRDVIREIEQYHATIADKFFIGFGARLAMIESTILIDALLLLKAQGVIALPVHDAVLVPQSEAMRASDALMAAAVEFSPEYGARPSIEFGV